MGNTLETPQTALKAIRAKCLDCTSGSIAEVRDCGLADCPLYRFRLGKNPDMARHEVSEDRPVQCILTVPESRIEDALRLEAEGVGGEFEDAVLRIDYDGRLYAEIIEVKS